MNTTLTKYVSPVQCSPFRYEELCAVRVITFPLISDPTHHQNCYKCVIREYFDIGNLTILQLIILTITLFF